MIPPIKPELRFQLNHTKHDTSSLSLTLVLSLPLIQSSRYIHSVVASQSRKIQERTQITSAQIAPTTRRIHGARVGSEEGLAPVVEAPVAVERLLVVGAAYVLCPHHEEPLVLLQHQELAEHDVRLSEETSTHTVSRFNRS